MQEGHPFIATTNNYIYRTSVQQVAIVAVIGGTSSEQSLHLHSTMKSHQNCSSDALPTSPPADVFGPSHCVILWMDSVMAPMWVHGVLSCLGDKVDDLLISKLIPSHLLLSRMSLSSIQGHITFSLTKIAGGGNNRFWGRNGIFHDLPV